MKTNALKLSVALLSGGLLSACGGDDGGSTGTVNTAATAYDSFTGLAPGTQITAKFIDAPVSGLSYSSQGYNASGKTALDGSFSCYSGDVIEFKIGALSLGTSICQGIVTPQTLSAVVEKQLVDTVTTTSSGSSTTTGLQSVVVEKFSTKDAPVLNRVRLLMTLDQNQIPADGITLPTDLTSVTETISDFSNTTAFETTAQQVVDKLYPGENRTLVTSADAQTHFEGQLLNLVGNDFENYDLSSGAFIDKVAVAAAKAQAEQSAANNGYGNGDD